MKKALSVSIVCVLAAGAAAFAAPYTGPWLQTWDFNDGLQGWTKTQGPGYWVDPALDPNGPVLPDGGVSNAGGGNLYAPDGTTFQYNLANPVNSFVIQVDAWLPNLMPLNINQYLPGNGIQGAGVGAITQAENKHMYVAGRNPDGPRIRDHSWDNTNRDRSWLFEEVGVAKANMWDKWVTLQFEYNWNNSGKFTGHVYTPWDSGVHDGPGWFSFAEYNIHAETAKQFVDRLIVGSVIPGTNSWTQGQFDNVKFVPEPATLSLLVLGGLAMLRRRR